MNRKFKTPSCAYEMKEGGQIVTDGIVRRKITGTTFGAVLGHNPYVSPFEAACRLLGLIDEDISDKPAVRAGRELELPIIHYLNGVYEMTMIPDEELGFFPRDGPHEGWVSDFDDPTFAGHIDGMAIQDGKDYILEIKTARDPAAWENGIPQHYQDQVRLYDHFLTNQDRAYVGVCFVDESAYSDPSSFVPSHANTTLLAMMIDKEQTAIDIDYARSWYAAYIENGTTPPYNPNIPRDVEIWTFLEGVAAGPGSIANDVDRLAELEIRIKEHDAEIDDERKEAEDLRKRIKEHLVHNGLGYLDSGSSRYIASIREQKRTKIDKDLMIQDGLDPERYIKTEISNVFTIKERK